MAFKLNLGSLTVSIGADTEDFDEGMKDVEKGLNKNAKSLRDSANDWAKWGAGMAAAMGVGLVALTKSNLTVIKELKILAGAANVTVKEFEQGAFAASQFGIETEKYGDILKDVNDRVGDFVATGGGPMLDFFEQIGPKIGVTIDDFKNLSGQEALGLYVKSLEKANLSQQDMTFFMEAIASDSTRLLPLFKDNAKALKEMTKEAKELGIGLSDVDVAAVEMANSELAKVSGLMGTLGKELAVKFAPIVKALAELFLDASKEAGSFGSVIDQVIKFATGAIGVFADGVKGIQVIFKGLEVVVRSVFTSMTKVFDAFIGGSIQQIGRSIVDGIVMPFRSILELAAEFSDTAGDALGDLDHIIEETFGKPKTGLGEFAQAQVDALVKSKKELNELLLEKIPSQQIDDFVLDANNKFSAALEKQRKEQTAQKNEDQQDNAAGLVPVVETYQAETIGLLEAMGLRFQSTEEVQIANNERELELLRQQKEKGLVLEKEFGEKSLELNKKIENAKRQSTMQNIREGFMLLASNSKKVQKAMKVAAVVQAIIKGKQAAVDAWQAGMSVGGPWAPVFAAAYAGASLLKTGSMISAIKGGGSGGGSAGGGIPSVNTSGTPPSGQAQQAGAVSTQQEQAPRRVQVEIVGEGAMTDFIRNLIMPGINEAIGDGFEFI